MMGQKQKIRIMLLHLLCLHITLSSFVHCYQYKVGDLDAWGLPTTSNPGVYSSWSQKHAFKIGDSLWFLYPPSQDSVVQVSEEAFSGCDISSPILKMDDGNSLFNLTAAGSYYFTSGVPGHCGKHQKLAVNVLFANGSSLPSDAPAASPSSSYPVVFGPTAPSSSVALSTGSAWAAGLLLLAALQLMPVH